LFDGEFAVYPIAGQLILFLVSPGKCLVSIKVWEMKAKVVVLIVVAIALILSACGNQQVQQLPSFTNVVKPTSASTDLPKLEFSSTSHATVTTPLVNATVSTVTQELESFPLSERGPYWTGKSTYTFIDESRDGREIGVTIWYPAVKETNAEGNPISLDAVPDMNSAPYPLILTGRNSGNYLYQSHLASHGFVMIIVRSPSFSYEAPWNNSVIDAPLDFLFVLNRITSNPPEGLEDVLDTDRVGVAGYSSDGLFSLALGGARINPEYYFSQCAHAPTLDPPLSSFLINYFCKLSERWDEFSSQVGAEISTVTEGLWQPTTDDRILAVMPMAPDSAWLYGAEGLAAIKIPSLIIAGTADELVSYKMTSSYVYEHLVNSDKVLISFIGKHHMMVEQNEVIRRINHFTVAFFGYYLQGRMEYADYFSENYVSHFDDLFWGVYPDE
jgi:predicted dienelactone hydrolase